jgi:hypothetical protein
LPLAKLACAPTLIILWVIANDWVMANDLDGHCCICEEAGLGAVRL